VIDTSATVEVLRNEPETSRLEGALVTDRRRLSPAVRSFTARRGEVITEAWRRYYNIERPHSSLGYRPPAPAAIIRSAPPPGSAPIRPCDGQKADRASRLTPNRFTSWGQA